MHHWRVVLKKLVLLVAAGLLFAPAAHADVVLDTPKAKKLYLVKCSKCHKLYDPAGYDDPAWEEWSAKMKKKAKLSDEQYGQVKAYTETLRKK